MAILLVAGILIAGVVIWVVPIVATTAARSVASAVDAQRGRSIDQDMLEARLTRIEEAIDAMALQIERLTDQQRALTAPGDRALGTGDPSGPERSP